MWCQQLVAVTLIVTVMHVVLCGSLLRGRVCMCCLYAGLPPFLPVCDGGGKAGTSGNKIRGRGGESCS